MSTEDRLDSLYTKLKNDKNLAAKLDLLEEIQLSNNRNEKRKCTTAVRNAKVQKSADGSAVKRSARNATPRPAELSEEVGLDDGAPNADVSNHTDREHEECDNNNDPLGALENLLNQEEEEDSQDEEGETSDSDDFNFFGQTAPPSWTPSKKALNLFLKVADLELSREVISKIEDEFKTSDDLETHFQPPKFPPSLWSLVKDNHYDLMKLMSLFRFQQNLYLSVKPLLAALEICPKECQDYIVKAIQLICSTNLNLNRFRRTTIAPHLKADLRKEILALPILHNSFFGDDFSKASDSILKEHSALEKILKKNNPRSYHNNRYQNQPNSSSSHYSGQKSFRGSNRQRFRGRGGRGGRGGKAPYTRYSHPTKQSHFLNGGGDHSAPGPSTSA